MYLGVLSWNIDTLPPLLRKYYACKVYVGMVYNATALFSAPSVGRLKIGVGFGC
jgi:hypothetical protein